VHNGDGCLYASNVTPFVDKNTAPRWVIVATQLSGPTPICVVYLGQPADITVGERTPICGGRSQYPLNNILPPQAEDMIDKIVVASDDDGKTQPPNPRSF
jgi:hypothetical protein